ncbi:Hypothetical protein EHI5A_062760 [Entamoeba histolytica KU27]|uniref:Uncharacterized protein n=1 Tax=Entamoeba histolytica KU27 TaxID=885311 RepID=M2Q883_ENTHI|nr:Hypothetical protein EHI5A_062760 [Entamoeba histolytica KU27]
MIHSVSPNTFYTSENQTKKQTLIKRESTNREHLSNAAIIGLANCYGIDLEIKCSTVKSDNQVTYDNLIIESSSLFPRTLSSSVGATRNDKKTVIALIFNTLSSYIIQTNNLSYQLTKSRSTKKTQKLIKFKWIDPFNEYGFYAFGAAVIEIVHSLPKTFINKKQQCVHLEPINNQILALFQSFTLDQTKLSDNGKLLFPQNPVSSIPDYVTQISQFGHTVNGVFTSSDHLLNIQTSPSLNQDTSCDKVDPVNFIEILNCS